MCSVTSMQASWSQLWDIMDLRGFEGFQTKKDYSKQQREFIHKQKRIGSIAVSGRFNNVIDYVL